MRELTGESFEEAVLGAETPVVVDFWAPWCGPCKRIEPILEELATAHDGRLAVVKVDIDRYPELASRYEVLTLPTTALFAGGELRATVVGARGRAHYERAFSAWLS